MDRRPQSSFALVAAVAALLLAALVAAFAPSMANAQQATAIAADSEATRPAGDDSRCEYGIALAMAGEVKQAESVFVAVLSSSPGDARALANLGNLRVLEGDLDVALVFYNQAVKADAADAGIKLNRATTLMLMGDMNRAELEAGEAVKQAGGEEAAAKLIGLSAESDAAESRGSDKPFVSKQEIRALLSAAKSRVPGDSVAAGAATDSTRTKPRDGKKSTTWRSAGPRAGDSGDIAAVLYWKR